jgi:hypothetical protein
VCHSNNDVEESGLYMEEEEEWGGGGLVVGAQKIQSSSPEVKLSYLGL